MIILNGSGRFGNQIFEYVYTESLRKPNEKVYSYGMKSLLDAIDGNKFYHNTDNQKHIHFYNVYFRRILSIFVKLHLISYNYDDGKGKISFSKGILPIRYINGYFQSDKYYTQEYLDKVKNGNIMTWNKSALTEAINFVNINCPNNKTPCFIHIRHGDYPLDWKLNDKFYNQALEAHNITNPHYFILGDDPLWAEDFFKNLPSKTISKNSFLVDFLIMQQCMGGIISNSSFAWWGAYLCKNKEDIIAPKYWIGYKKNEWIPKDINTNRFKWIFLNQD